MNEPTIEGPFGPYREGGRVSTRFKFGGTFQFEVEHVTAGRHGASEQVWPEEWNVQLPHSCNKWVIGDAAALAEFIAEAQAVADWLATR